jgi:hypothetical protein
LDYWDVAALDGGKVDGKGYGNKFSDRCGPECGRILILQTNSK